MVKSSPQKKAQEFKGVRKRKWGKWVSEVRVPNYKSRIWLGSYDTPQQAARAYDCVLYCLKTSNPKFDFPYSLPEIQSATSLSPAEIQAAAAAKLAREEIRQSPDECSAFSATESVSFTVKDLINEMFEMDFTPDEIPYNILVVGYFKAGEQEEALKNQAAMLGKMEDAEW